MKPIPLWLWTPETPAAPGEGFARSFLEALTRAAPRSTLSVFSPGGRGAPQGEAIAFAGGPVCHGPGSWPSLLRGPSFFLCVFFRALRRRPGLIVLTHVRLAPSARLLKKLLHVPFAVVAHGREILDEPGSRAVRALADADLVLAESAFSRDQLREVLGLAEERTGVLHAPFEPAGFAPGAKPPYLLSRYGLGAEQPVILTFSRPGAPESAFPCEQVIEALPRIRERLADVHCLVCGFLRPDEIEKISAMLRYFHLEDCVTFAGAISDEERADHYNLADLVAIPGKGQGFATPLLEAMACGTPVLGGNRDGAADTLFEGRLGVLVDPDSPPRIAEAAIGILTGSSDLALLYRPREMRKRAVAAFGFDRFLEGLTSNLNHLGLDLSLEAEPRDRDRDPDPAPRAAVAGPA